MSQTVMTGDADIASAATLFAEPSRAKILIALVDGRSLPANVLAAESGVSAQAASTQLARLRRAGLIDVEQSGRHRYYRITTAQVAHVLEALAAISPTLPMRSLREGTRAAALRRARTCYDHLAGWLGVAVTTALLEHGALSTNDGIATTERRRTDPISSQLRSHPYELGPQAEVVLGRIGVPASRLDSRAATRPLLKFCLDWTEQRHHVAGRLGSELLNAFVTNDWIVRAPRHRAVTLTPLGAEKLREYLGVVLDGRGSLDNQH